MTVKINIVNAALPLRDESRLYSLTAEDGKWTAISKQSGELAQPGAIALDDWDGTEPADGRLTLDAKGSIALPGFADAHMHLDKSFSLPKVGNVSGTLEEAVQNYAAAAPGFGKEEIKARMMRAALQSIACGTSALRSHLDFHVKHGPEVALRTIEAALEVKAMLAPYADLQLFPMIPYYDLTEKALEIAAETVSMGVTGLGGAPHLSPTPEADIDRIMALADRLCCPVDLHADESDDPSIRTAAHIARRTKEYGWFGKVAVGHLCSLAAMPDADAEPIIRQLAEAGVGAVTLPGANLYLQGRRDRHPVRRGVTRVKELLAAGIPLAAASDNIHDPFHPFGRGDLLLIGLVTAYAAHMGSPADMRAVLRMITANPAAVMGLHGYGMEVGNDADFVILDAATPEELFAMVPERRWVWRRGRCLKAAARRAEWSVSRLRHYWEDAVERVHFRPSPKVNV